MPGICLFVMNQKGHAVVEALAGRAVDLSGLTVVAARDSHVQQDFYDEIQAVCGQRGIPFFDRASAEELALESAIAIGWRWMIRGCEKLIVFHDSLLPKYRGFAPLPTALINGEEEVGVTALFGAGEYDRGAIIAQRKLAIQYPARIQDVIERISVLYADLAVELVDALLAGRELPARAQDETAATYSLWRDEEDYRIDWSRDAGAIRRWIDALGFPYLGACSRVDGRTVRIVEAAEEADVRVEQRVPGKVIFVRDGKPVVVCGTGLLRLLDVRDDSGSLLPLGKFRTRFC